MKKLTWALLTVAILLCPIAVQADPHRPIPMSPQDEQVLIVRAQRAREKAIFIKAYKDYQFRAAVFAAKLEQARYDEAQRERVAAAVEHYSGSSTDRKVSEQSSGRCGGDLPPCYVMMRESRGSLTAENPVSTASGKWQFLDSTWNGYGGYSHASDAPESVQDARARELWANGAGCSHWEAC